MISVLQSWPIAAAVGMSAAVALVGLHFLRTAPQRRIVPTTLFWRAAQLHQRSHSLWGRFSRLGSLLLLLGIATSLMLALSGWRRPSTNATIVVVDLGPAADLNQAIRRMKADLPNDALIPLIVSSRSPRLVGDATDPLRVSLQLLERETTDWRSASPAQALRLAATLASAPGDNVVLYTDRSPPVELIPASLRDRMETRLLETAAPTCWIAGAVWQVPAADGVGELIVTVRGESKESFTDLRVAWIQDNARSEAPLTLHDGSNAAELALRVVGGPCSIQLLKDGQGVRGSVVTLLVPQRGTHAFAIDDGIPRTLRDALNVIAPLSSEATQLRLPVARLSDGQARPSTPGIFVVPSVPSTGAASAVSLVANETDGLTRGLALDSAFTSAAVNGLSDMSGDRPLLTNAAGQCVALLRPIATDATTSALLLSESLFGPDATISRSPGFFLLLQRACRTLFKQPLDDVVALPLQRMTDDPTHPLAQDAVSAHAALVDHGQSAPRAATIRPTVGVQPTTAMHFDWWYVALAGGALLLLVETVLHARRKIA